jgi:asparagine synthase (glutamine-hydrolysing)
MCGICGKAIMPGNGLIDEEFIQGMMDTMIHRGPDDKGYHLAGNVGLGHRRLSIIDLSRGKQPIYNEDGQVVIVFNGEIYNYQSLRKMLISKGHQFRTETDTEVIVHLYEEYGYEAVKQLRGMFAFAIWDAREKTLFVARDRVGIKPLYYYWNDSCLVFGSDIKAILHDPTVNRDMNYKAIDRFFTYFYMPGNETLFKHIKKLPPGHYLLWKNANLTAVEYWDFDFSKIGNALSFDEAKWELEELLKESVKLHMISDVPVGILLSGGVDSTALLSLAIEESNKDLIGFTIGFEGETFADERKYARLAAEKFRIRHYESTITCKEFFDFLPQYVWYIEEPVCEPPAIALYYITKLAKNYVKVLISGEGGDEAFAGYQNYRSIKWLEHLKNSFGSYSGLLFQIIGKLGSLKRLQKYAPVFDMPIEKYYYSRTALPSSYFNHLYPMLYSDSFRKYLDKDYSLQPTNNLFRKNIKDIINKMLYVDSKSWLPDDLLVKADKMTMANSVELRVPLLDHKILEHAASLPPHYKLNGFSLKHILKSTFRKRVPEVILNRKKTGFPVPYRTWIKNEMKPYVKGVLLDKRCINRGFFNETEIEKLLNINDNKNDLSQEIFSLLVFELWNQVFIDCKT